MKRPFDPTCEDCCDPLELCPIHAGDMESLPEFTIPEDKLAYLIVCDDCGGLGCWKCGWQAIDGFVEGVIEITPAEAESSDAPLIIVEGAT